jgi:hypothetical protein
LNNIDLQFRKYFVTLQPFCRGSKTNAAVTCLEIRPLSPAMPVCCGPADKF